MAEDEIIKKHTQVVYETIRNPDKKWFHKLKEILQEVLIIVFAVSVSIWFHGWAEDRKDQKEEKEFFIGLKEDLQADVKEMQSDRAAYEQIFQHAQYFLKAGSGAEISKDSVMQYYWIFFAGGQFNPRISRFEALKGSGKLDIIEDKKQLYNLIDIYQKTFPNIFRINQSFATLDADKIDPYIGDAVKLDAAGGITNAEEVLRSSKMRVYMNQLVSSAENCVKAYTTGIEKSNELIKQIE